MDDGAAHRIGGIQARLDHRVTLRHRAADGGVVDADVLGENVTGVDRRKEDEAGHEDAHGHLHDAAILYGILEGLR